jgi:hypothetical protein
MSMGINQLLALLYLGKDAICYFSPTWESRWIILHLLESKKTTSQIWLQHPKFDHFFDWQHKTRKPEYSEPIDGPRSSLNKLWVVLCRYWFTTNKQNRVSKGFYDKFLAECSPGTKDWTFLLKLRNRLPIFMKMTSDYCITQIISISSNNKT